MSEQAPKSYEFRVKLSNGAEFHGIGPVEEVNAHFKEFLAAQVQLNNIQPMQLRRPSLEGVDLYPDEEERSRLPHGEVMRFFKVHGDAISLTQLPKTDNPGADGLILLLAGYHHLRNMPRMLASKLAKSAVLSGIEFERLDRLLAAREFYVNAKGMRKGTTYGLTNSGRAHARLLLAEMTL